MRCKRLKMGEKDLSIIVHSYGTLQAGGYDGYVSYEICSPIAGSGTRPTGVYCQAFLAFMKERIYLSFRWMASIGTNTLRPGDVEKIVAMRSDIRTVPWTIDGTDEFMAYLRQFSCEVRDGKVRFRIR